MNDDIQRITDTVREQSAFVARIMAEVEKVVVGQKSFVERILVAMLANGHILIEGVPGLAKTTTVKTLAGIIDARFQRIQFTPDLLPADLIGTLIYNPRDGQFITRKGPIFANIILADEINRTPPKTQAALLEAMQERRISSGGTDFALDEPFFVLATQNPIEQEGTYPLPEAQLDRFLFNIKVDYPSWKEEIEIMQRVSGSIEQTPTAVLGREDILALQKLVRRAPVADHIFHYAATIVRATRRDDELAPEFIKDWLSYGAGPRASIFLILAGKARAILHGRVHVAVEDVQAVALPILRHRIIPNFAAQSEGLSADDIIAKLLETIPADEKLYEKAGSRP